MFELYRFYFQTLCELHPDLLHSEANSIFRVIHIEEAFGDFRRECEANGTIVRLIYPTYSLTDQGSDARRPAQCGILIAKNYDRRFEGGVGNFAALEFCRKIADDFFEKIITDSRNGYPLFHYSANKPSQLNWTAQVLTTTGDATYAGLLCTFEISEYKAICIDNHPDATWRQPTPEPAGFWLTAEGGYWLTAAGGKWSLS